MFSSSSFKLLLPVYLLSFFSGLILLSVSSRLFWFQVFWVAIGTFFIFITWHFDLRGLIRNRGLIAFLYVASIFFLIVTLFMPAVRGIHAWIPLGPFFLQPVEAVKITLLLMYAYFFARRHHSLGNPSNIGISFLVLAVPTLIVLKQPDTGSALILIGMWLSFLFMSGLRLRHLVFGVVLTVIGSFFLWGYLADYQRERILGTLDPDRDPLGINYNVIQSKIAIGSAGWFGKGFGQGTQVQLGFLPEAETDFIAASFIEEWGLIGGLVVLASFFMLCRAVIKIGLEVAENNFDRFICLGAIVIFGSHFIINIGSVTGLLPVIGLPFPFLSYGGSNLLTNFALIAIINAIAVRT